MRSSDRGTVVDRGSVAGSEAFDRGSVAGSEALDRGSAAAEFVECGSAARGLDCGSVATVGRDRGSVTAEAAVAVPTLVVFTMALVWALTAAAAQIQCVDAARAGARAAARSESRAAVLAAARSAAPPDARVSLGRGGDLWRVRVEAPSPGPGALALTLSAEAAALAEDSVGRAAP